MRPFRNHGWAHYEKVQAIIPGSRARGTHAYRATIAPQPTITNEPDQGGAGPALTTLPCAGGGRNITDTSGMDNAAIEGGDTSGSTITVSTGNAATTSMDLDLTSMSHPPSINSSKRSHSAMSVESELLPGASDSTPATPLDPVSNKMQKGSGSRASRGSKHSGPKVTSTARLANKITPATAVMGMQGSINRLTDIFEKSMVPGEDPSIMRREKAMQFLQEVDDGLSVSDKVAMISIFMKQAVAVDTYLSLTDAELRQAWIREMVYTTG